MPKKVQEQQDEELKYYTKEELVQLFDYLEKILILNGSHSFAY